MAWAAPNNGGLVAASHDENSCFPEGWPEVELSEVESHGMGGIAHRGQETLPSEADSNHGRLNTSENDPVWTRLLSSLHRSHFRRVGLECSFKETSSPGFSTAVSLDSAMAKLQHPKSVG
jgi:hypothetical protein